MMIEAGELRDSDIARISVTGQGDRENAFSCSARFTHQRVTRAVGQRNVANDNIDGRLGVKPVQTALQSFNRRNIVTPTLEQPAQDISSVRMIFHYQNLHIGLLGQWLNRERTQEWTGRGQKIADCPPRSTSAWLR